MLKTLLTASALAALALASMPVAAQSALATPMAESERAGPPKGRGSYQDMATLYADFMRWQNLSPADGDDSVGVPSRVRDFGAATVAKRRTEMASYLSRMQDMNVASWDRSQQVDWLAVRAKMLQQHFTLQVGKPWERDPGFYVDQMQSVAYADLPATGQDLAKIKRGLKDIPLLVRDAKANLANVPADFVTLALFNLRNADGVGHGMPYRPVPPAGVIGWYDDMLGRARTAQPELVADLEAAKRAAVELEAHLKANQGRWTAPAGVGKANFNWYLKNVKLLPYNTDDLLVLGARETERLWAQHALEKHRNRNLPELKPAASEAEYEALKAETDRRIRTFLAKEDIITVPEDIGKLYVNVPWIVRDGGRNFWEEVQFRDPSPDYFHATIPGHAFDGQMAKRVKNPIRATIADGVRAEGWGVYLEEAAQRLGFFEDIPRVRELIDIFGIFRAVRVAGDIDLQLNRANLQQIVDRWKTLTPWLDNNVARVDAEIYLRRPPGYGLGYTIGMIEMSKLLADVKVQQRDKFVLKTFHDDFMAAGRVPLSLLRWEMTGLDNEVQHFWTADPLPAQ